MVTIIDQISSSFLFSHSFYILDKFRLKFRELFSACCCCCKPIPRMKSASSTMIQFRPSGLVQHSIMSVQTNRSSLKNNYGPGSINTNNNNNMSRHNGINAYTHHRPLSFRLTNV